MRHIGLLFDAVKGAIVDGRVVFGLAQHTQPDYALTPVCELNGLHRADRRTFSADRTPVLPVLDEPGQVSVCQIAWGRWNG
jgi:hypothetical protein